VSLRAVLFDAAGTLIHLREPVGDTYARLARDHGVDLPAWRLSDAFRRILRAAPPPVFPGASPADLDALERSWWRDVVRSTIRAADSTVRIRDFDAYFDRLFATFAAPESWYPATGASEALGELRARGLRLGVVSNFDRRLHGILEGLDLRRYFESVTLASEIGSAKPDPRIFEVALAGLGIEPSCAALVGNDPDRDLAAARSLGIRAVDATSLATLAALPEQIVHLTREKCA
jgi:putative hydrolase of the HAD superfamily